MRIKNKTTSQIIDTFPCSTAIGYFGGLLIVTFDKKVLFIVENRGEIDFSDVSDDWSIYSLTDKEYEILKRFSYLSSQSVYSPQNMSKSDYEELNRLSIIVPNLEPECQL